MRVSVFIFLAKRFSILIARIVTNSQVSILAMRTVDGEDGGVEVVVADEAEGVEGQV